MYLREFYMSFGKWAESYFEQGYSVIPLNGKKPMHKGWEKLSNEKPSHEMIETWIDKNSNANIGVVCGQSSGVVAFDYDYEGNDAERIETIIQGIIPPSPVRKRGKKGWTAFYRWSDGVENKWFNRNSQRMVDVIISEKQTVLPPSIHPDTGERYQWITEDTLLDVSPKDLPLLTRSMIEKIEDLSKIDFSKSGNMFEKIGGRHDVIMVYAWANIESVTSLEDFVEKLIEYDLKKNPEDPYFLDRTYFKGKNQIEAATEIALKAEKTVKNGKKKRGQEWSLGSQPKKMNELFLEKSSLDEIAKRYRHFAEGFRYKTVTDKGEEKMNPDYIGYSDFVRNVCGLRIYNEKYNFVWQDGKYQAIEKMQIKKLISDHIFFGASPNYIENYFKRVIIDSQIMGDIPKAPNGLLNFGDKVYDIAEDKFIKKTKAHFFTSKLPIKYDKQAKCENFINFLEDVFSGDKGLIDASQKMFGYILLGGEPFLQKAFVLIGSGRNGKGIFIKALKLILGDSYTVVSLSSIDKPFSTVSLDGSLANITEESPSEVNSEVFKNLVGGGEIQAGQKNKPEYRFKVNARFVFACNDFPYFDDKNTSMNDRLFIIPFNKTYVEGVNRDNELYEKKIEPEAEGILVWAIEGAHKILKDRTIEQPHSSEIMKEEYREDTDQAYAWFKECVKIEGIESDKFKTISEIYLNYTLWCEQAGCRPLTKIAFGRRVRRLVREESKQRIDQTMQDIDNRRHRGFKNVSLRLLSRNESVFGQREVIIGDYC
jgi:P4 family phage/plasmid primase-like protien